MSVAVVLLTLILLAAVIAVVSRPLFAPRAQRDMHLGAHPAGHELSGEAIVPEALRREELEASREAKYREIRDAELDYRTGKLSREDFEAINATLRAEAVEILDQLETLNERQNLSTRVS